MYQAYAVITQPAAIAQLAAETVSSAGEVKAAAKAAAATSAKEEGEEREEERRKRRGGAVVTLETGYVGLGKVLLANGAIFALCP